MSTTSPQDDSTYTSLAQLFSATINGTQVKAIEIPLFQRDYAQGRQGELASHVRQRFIFDLCRALDSNLTLHLDFVFGDVVDGTLYPLDGQQRLTTLFLLHCYLAWNLPETAGVLQPWHAFHYATRPGARAFCQFLTQCRPDVSEIILSDWLRDQASYLPTWKHDPTIQGMLIVLDALHTHYCNQPAARLRSAWQRLTDPNWMAQALDVWLEDDNHGGHKPKAIGSIFAELFTRDACSATTPLRIFNFGDFGDAPVGVNLFHACCMLYGTRSWSLSHTLMLYGVLIGFMAELSRPDLQRRLRLLRNLIEASRNEIRADDTRNNMPALLREVDIIMTGEQLTGLVGINTFNQVQVRNEQDKQVLMTTHPVLQEAVDQLEDHELLRGGLTAFDLSTEQHAAIFKGRAAQFHHLFKLPYSLVNAALLAKGNPGRGYVRESGYRLYHLGAPRSGQSSLWENHWRARRSESPHPSAAALASLLDDMTAEQSPQSIVDAFLSAPNTIKDWRYYIAKYPAMRDQPEFAGSYVIAPGHGYAICMLKTDSCDHRSNHHDGYLLALAQEVPEALIGNINWPRCFPGYETEVRYLKLHNSGLQIRCVDAGWQFSCFPDDAQWHHAFEVIAKRHPYYHSQDLLYFIPQYNGVDTEDRIELGSKFLHELAEAGF